MISDDDLDEAARWIKARLEAMLLEVDKRELSSMEVKPEHRMTVGVLRRERLGRVEVRTPSLERYGL